MSEEKEKVPYKGYEKIGDKEYIEILQTSPILFETEHGRWEPEVIEGRILVPIEDLQDKDKLFRILDEWNRKNERIKAKFYEDYGLTTPDGTPTRDLNLYLPSVPGSELSEKSLFDMTDEEYKKISDYLLKVLRKIREEGTPDKATEKALKELEKKLSDRGQISASLASGVSLRREPTLFDNLEEDKRLAVIQSDKENYIDRRGKPIALTNGQTRLIYALSHYLSQYKTDPDIVEYMNSLESNPKKMPKKIERTLNLKDFCKLYYSSDGKARTRDLDSLRKELRTLSNVRQVLYFGGAEKKARLIAPLISVEEELEDLTPDKSLNMDLANIRFSPIFLFKMTKEYLPYSRELFRIWGKNGNGTRTELFSVLISDLGSKFPYKRQTALTEAHKIRRTDFATKEEYLSAVKKARRKALTYRQNIYTLLERVTTDYSSTRQYKSKLKSDLESALNTIKDEIGIITEWKLTNSKNGDPALEVVFNPDYMKE